MLYMNLPMDVIRYIHQYLAYKYSDYNLLREQYEKARRYIPITRENIIRRVKHLIY